MKRFYVVIVLAFLETSSFSQSPEEKTLVKCSYWTESYKNGDPRRSGTAFLIKYSNSLYLVSALHLIAEAKPAGDNWVIKNPDSKYCNVIAVYLKTDSPGYTPLPLYDAKGHALFRYAKYRDSSNIDFFVVKINKVYWSRFQCYIDSAMVNRDDINRRDSVFSYGYDSVLDIGNGKKLPKIKYESGEIWDKWDKYPDIEMYWYMAGSAGRSGSPVFYKTKKGIKLVGVFTQQKEYYFPNKIFSSGINISEVLKVIANYDHSQR